MIGPHDLNCSQILRAIFGSAVDRANVQVMPLTDSAANVPEKQFSSAELLEFSMEEGSIRLHCLIIVLHDFGNAITSLHEWTQLESLLIQKLQNFYFKSNFIDGKTREDFKFVDSRIHACLYLFSSLHPL